MNPKLALLVLASLVLGCSSGEGIDPNIDKLGRATGPVGPAATRPPATAPAGAGVAVRGKVVETMNVPNYTYVLLQTGDKQLWAAVPSAKVAVGQDLEVIQNMVMRDFTSRTLNRTFDEIIFGTLPGGPSAPAHGGQMPAASGGELPPGHPPIPKDAG